MGYTVVPDRAGGYAPLESDWDVYIKDNFNTGVMAHLLANVTISVPALSIDFSSISSAYSHLMLVGNTRSDFAAANRELIMRFNGDVAANYDNQTMTGSASASAASQAFATASPIIANAPAASATASVFGSFSVVVPHYTNSANNKTATARSCHKASTSSAGLQALSCSTFWRSNAAINRVTFSHLGGSANFVAGSRITLYGLL